MQDKYKMGLSESSLNVIHQPDSDLNCSFETTYTSDTKRSQTGVLQLTSMFSVEAFSYSATNISVAEVAQILGYIAKGKKFYLHYFSPFYGVWRTAPFYVGQGQISLGCLKENEEMYTSFSFQMTGVNPI